MENNNKKTIVYITEDFLAPDLALRMKNEGHNVLLAQKNVTEILGKTIKRVPYEDRLKWARKADLVLYDDKSAGEAQMLRKEGISTIGGSKQVDRMELDRVFGIKLAKACGILTPKFEVITSLKQAKEFLVKHGGRWVLKQQGKLDGIKGLNFVAKMDDSKDLIDYIDILESKWIPGLIQDFILQEFIEGHEFATGSYWNGNEFMKDKNGDEICEENWEHKALFPGDLGESTGEQYTIMRYRKAKDSKLFMETLDKCRDMLKKIDFRGDFDVNCKVNEKGVYFLEWTPRMGVPATSAQIAIHKTSWYELLKAMADGRQDPNFDYDPKYCIVSWLYTKPFPYVNSHRLTKLYEDLFKNKPPTKAEEINELLSFRLSDSMGIIVNFKEPLTKEEMKHLHFDGVQYEGGIIKVANSDGYILTATGMGETVKDAGKSVEKLLKKIVVPKQFWRNDFGAHYNDSREDLTKWGYLNDPTEAPEGVDEDGYKKEIEAKYKKEYEEKLAIEVGKMNTREKKIKRAIKQIVYAK